MHTSIGVHRCMALGGSQKGIPWVVEVVAASTQNLYLTHSAVLAAY